MAETGFMAKPSSRGRGNSGRPSPCKLPQADKSAPESTLELEYVHGYAGETPGSRCGVIGAGAGQADAARGTREAAATRNTNVLWLRTGELLFPASAVVVIHDFKTNRQRFFTGHDEVIARRAHGKMHRPSSRAAAS